MKKNNLGKLNKISMKFLERVKKHTVVTLIFSLIFTGLVSFVFGATEDVRPNATASEAGGSCTTADAHTAMDDDVDGGGDASVCTADSATADHDIRLNFATPIASPSTGTNLQTFAILAINSQTSGNGVATVALDLYCNGSLVEAGADQNLGDTYAIITETFTFNATSCAADGSDVEVLVDCTAVDAGGTNHDTSCTYEAVEWRVVFPSAPTVTTSAASSITASTATLNGNVTNTGDENVSPRGFASSTDSTLSTGVATSTETVGGPFGTGTFTGSMGGLSGNTTYYFRAYATNSAGDGLGSILSFLTLPNAPGTPTFSSITNNAMRVSWTAPTGGATSYKVERCTGAGCSGFSQIASGETNTFYDDSGLSASTVYRYRIRATNATGDGAYSGEAEQSTAAETTLEDSTDPGPVTIAPGASVTDLDNFILSTTGGVDTVTAVTVTLSPSTATTTISKIEVTDNSNVDVCTDIDVDGSTSNVLNFSGCSLDVTTSPAIYKVRITPKTHANMPAVPGASVAVTGTVTSITATNATTGTDTDSATVTIDNLSPGNVTGSSAAPGNAQNGLAWTNPADSDLSKIMVLASTTAITFTPVEGTTYATSTLSGASRVACYGLQVSCTDNADGVGLVNGTAYYYKIFALDSNGNWSETGVEPSGSPATPVEPITTLTDGSNPSSVTIAPGGAITDLNRFILTTNTGTDAITSITVTLSSNAGVGTLTITDNADASLGSIGGGTGSGIVTGANAISISSTNAVTGGTTFKVRVTPLSHANMPAVPGAENVLTGAVTDWAGTNTKAGQSNDTSATVTIDNASPANVTSATGTAGDTLVNLAWTNPADSDLSKIMVLASTTAITFTPVEGTTYATSTLNGASRVACYGLQVSCTDDADGAGLVNGTAYYYKIFALDSRGNWSETGVEPTGSPATPAVPAEAISQAHYRWRNDDSGDASATYKQTEDTALTSDIFVGDRLRLRLSVANSGGVGTGLEFLLEHSSTTCSVWIQVPTSNGAGTHWSISNSPYFADGTATADSSGLTNPEGMSFVSGFLHDNSNITSGITLNTNEFTELEYAVQSTSSVEAGTQYCFRVSDNGSTSTFTFDATPSITLSSSNIRPQGGGGGGSYGTIPGQESGSGPQQSGGGAGGESGGTGEGSGSGGQESGGGTGGGGGGDLGLFLPSYPSSLLSLKIFDLKDFSLAQFFRIFR